MRVEDIARVCHEANRALQIVQSDPTIPVSPSWDDASEIDRESTMRGVEGVLQGNTPEESHEGWMQHRIEAGWVYGEVKDPVAKTHPLLVPYDELDAAARSKDALFYNVVMALSS